MAQQEDFDKLLEAMQQCRQGVVETLAPTLFLTRDGTDNRVEISAFEAYAHCRIVLSKEREYAFIYYGDMTYYYKRPDAHNRMEQNNG